jgi:hypothetical protein
MDASQHSTLTSKIIAQRFFNAGEDVLDALEAWQAVPAEPFESCLRQALEHFARARELYEQELLARNQPPRNAPKRGAS